MKRILKLFDYIFVLRPTLFFPVWTVFLAGFYTESKVDAAVVADAAATNGHLSPQPDFIWVGTFLTLLMGAVFILNQIMDRHTDDKNRKLFLIAQGHLTPKAAFIESVILIAAALGFAFVFSVQMGTLFLAILLLTGYLYSFSPFSFKDRPLLGLLANALGALLIFAAGWLVYGRPAETVLLHSVPYVCAVASVYLCTTLLDVQGDAASQKITFGVKYGMKTTIYVALLLETISMVSAYFLNDEIIFYPAFFSFPFFVWAGFRLRLKDVMRAIKYPILLLAFTVGIKWSLIYGRYDFFLLLLGVYAASKLYYKLRFGINYPNLST
ncbi:MAG: hypothetical protein D6743_17580 [Calditrichaeota bacterium]|nr:MAG: hypothetical protein D6743_17580 [Calditrichota bacterium]